jgi:hypothetical protein
MVMRELFYNGLLWALMYFGFVWEIAGCRRVAYAMAWFMILSMFAFWGVTRAVSRMKEVQASLEYMSMSYVKLHAYIDLTVAAVFIWFGAWITGIAYAGHIFLYCRAQPRVNKLLEQDAAEKESAIRKEGA